MNLQVYVMKNRISGFFEKPFCEIYDEKEYVEFLTAALAQVSVDELVRSKEFDLYKIGVFDNKTGLIDSNFEFVCSLEQICNDYITKHKGDSNGKE